MLFTGDKLLVCVCAGAAIFVQKDLEECVGGCLRACVKRFFGALFYYKLFRNWIFFWKNVHVRVCVQAKKLVCVCLRRTLPKCG